MAEKPAKSRRVAVVYHYFAHYRRPVFFELIDHGEHHYEFIGCDKSFGSGIKLISDFPEGRYRKSMGWNLGPLFIQPAAVIAACSRRYDTLILLGNSKWPTTWLAAIVGRLRGKRVLMWTHGWLREERGIQRRFRDTFYKLAHGLLVYNHRAKEIGIAHGFDPDRVHVIYNSLDTKAQDQVRQSTTADEIQEYRHKQFPGRGGVPVLTTVTRLLPEKRVDMLIEASGMLERRGVPVNVLVIGDGPERERLESQAANAGVHARFTGAIYDEKTLGRAFMATDLTIMPGAIGLLVMHSMAYGTPVLTHDNVDNHGPEFEAIKEGLTGGFFKEKDSGSLADAIERWVSNETETGSGREESRAVIDRFYNPLAQRILIDRAVAGDPPLSDSESPRTETLP